MRSTRLNRNDMLKTISSTLLAAMLVVAAAGICPGNPSRAADSTVQSGDGIEANASGSAVTTNDIKDAYIYLLGRILILRQQRIDFEKNGFEWNKLIYRMPGDVTWANPNLDVAYSEAWIAIDEKSCVRLDIPKIEGRYYTWQMLNGWGETILNINERTFAAHPNGAFALCLRGSQARTPAGVLRIDLPTRTARALARIELGGDPANAIALQRQFKLTPLGSITPAKRIDMPLFDNRKLPGVEAFDYADAILAGESDINPGMQTVREQVKAVSARIHSSAAEREAVGKAIASEVLPAFARALKAPPGNAQNGWTHAAPLGNYGENYRMRTVVNLGGIWANNAGEYTGFVAHGLDGSAVYTQTYPKDALPQSKVRYFWSIAAVDTTQYKVIPNSLNRFVLNRQNDPKLNADGSLTLVFAPRLPVGVQESNWLPTPEGSRYNLTFRFYGPTLDVTDGQYFPPPLMAQNQTRPSEPSRP